MRTLNRLPPAKPVMKCVKCDGMMGAYTPRSPDNSMHFHCWYKAPEVKGLSSFEASLQMLIGEPHDQAPSP